jgi:antagonist of KipI
MALQIVEPGILTTVQDLGRTGYVQYGVTRGGAMDPLALRAANRLVGNDENEAALEIASFPFSIRVLEPSVVAIAGAPYALRAGDRAVPSNAALFLRAGEGLAFGAPAWGRFAYLALAGGIDVPVVLGARATALRDGFGGYKGRALASGDRIRARRPGLPIERAGRILATSWSEHYCAGGPVRIILGPHFEYFGDSAYATLLAQTFRVSELSDRMGTRLVGQPLERRHGELLSCGVTRGAIQVPPDGQPIVLEADHQTTGGYPLIGTVIRSDLPRLAQKRPGETVTFAVTEVGAATQAARILQSLLERIGS